MIISRRGAASLAGVAALTLAACGTKSETQTAERATYRDIPEVVEAGLGNSIFSFDEATLQTAVGAVVVGTVTGEIEKLPTAAHRNDLGEGEPYRSLRDLELKVEEVIAGKVEVNDTLVVVDTVGWQYQPTERVRQQIVEDGTRLRPGDRVVVVLTPEQLTPSNRYLLLTESAYVFVDSNDMVVRTGRKDGLVPTLEGLSRKGVVSLLRAVCVGGCDRTTLVRYAEDGTIE